jgi:hypothetical protein
MIINEDINYIKFPIGTTFRGECHHTFTKTLDFRNVSVEYHDNDTFFLSHEGIHNAHFIMEFKSINYTIIYSLLLMWYCIY